MNKLFRACAKQALVFCLAAAFLAAPFAASAEKTVLITFAGDCTLGSEERERANSTSLDSYVNSYGYDYPFSGVYDILSHDDLTVANLEGVFYNSEYNKVSKNIGCGNALSYKCSKCGKIVWMKY